MDVQWTATVLQYGNTIMSTLSFGFLATIKYKHRNLYTFILFLRYKGFGNNCLLYPRTTKQKVIPYCLL